MALTPNLADIRGVNETSTKNFQGKEVSNKLPGNIDIQVSEFSSNIAQDIKIIKDTASLINIPDNLLNENATNSSKKLEEFLTNCSGKTVIFPANKTFVFDEPVSITNVQNIQIDFNKTTLKLPDGFTGWDDARRYTNYTYVGDSILAVVDAEDVLIYRLKLDGNSQNISPSIGCIGVWVENASSVYFEDLNIANVNYHGIVVSSVTENIGFNGVYLENNFGSTNSSDVYVNNNPSDDVSFNDVTAERTTLVGNQVFYINGFNTNITNILTHNCSVALDYRKGKHTASNITIDSCNATVHIQSTSNRDLPEITVSNLTATNIYAGLKTRAGLGIWSAASAYFENVSLSFAEDATTNLYGVIIRRFSREDTIANVYFKNLTIENTGMAAIYYNNLNNSTKVESLTATQVENNLLRGENCTAIQVINSIMSENTSIYVNNKDGVFQIFYIRIN